MKSSWERQSPKRIRWRWLTLLCLTQPAVRGSDKELNSGGIGVGTYWCIRRRLREIVLLRNPEHGKKVARGSCQCVCCSGRENWLQLASSHQHNFSLCNWVMDLMGWTDPTMVAMENWSRHHALIALQQHSPLPRRLYPTENRFSSRCLTYLIMRLVKIILWVIFSKKISTMKLSIGINFITLKRTPIKNAFIRWSRTASIFHKAVLTRRAYPNFRASKSSMDRRIL